MAAYHTALWEALVDFIGATWPEVVAGGIYRSRELSRVDFEKKARAGKVPLCVVDLRPGPSSRGGVCNRTESVTVTINYVIGPDDEPLCSALVDKLQVLQQALWPQPFEQVLYPAGQVEAYPTVSDSMELPVNAYLLRTAQQFWAGAVQFSVLVGESP